ncbi:MAG: ribonuclease P protein component [Actinobacteria bacterium]|nr:ribonuclease P protein component [Actinomycetota bacterium]
MLPKANRLTKSDEIRAVIRDGRRSSSPLATIHYLPGSGRVAFVTPKTIGNAVIRNRVRRRAREIVRGVTHNFSGFDLVVRLHPGSAAASFRELQDAIFQQLERLQA